METAESMAYDSSDNSLSASVDFILAKICFTALCFMPLATGYIIPYFSNALAFFLKARCIVVVPVFGKPICSIKLISNPFHEAADLLSTGSPLQGEP